VNEPPTFLVPLVLLVPVAVLIVLSRYSGWNRLAEHYPGDRDFPRAAKWMGYRNYIPWSEISEIEKRSVWSGAVVAIRTRRAREVDFALRPSTFAVVRDQAKNAEVPGDY
jgi:hypothetical protein